MADEQIILPIIDSHIHLYPASETESLNWWTPDNPIGGQHSLEQYREATSSAPSLLGFVFVETDRKNDLESGAVDGSGWEAPLAEVSWLKRIALGQPRDGEGHTADDAKLCLGIVPWAPLPSGPEVMERYLDRVKEEAGDAWPKIKGFRYLLQDKPHGTMLDDKFIESVKLLGRRGFTFDVGVDQHRRGKKQLDEVIEFVDRVYDGVPEEEKVTLVLNHLCKPDFSIYNLASDPGFLSWRTTIYALSKVPNIYMKLSGGFSEMPDSLRNQDPNHIFEATLGWLGIVLATFGPSRIMYGSDWPVCTVNNKDAWPKWRSVVERMCWMATLGDEERAMIFGGTAKKAYKL
ncbi:L-rhamnono-gamma-lactonase [Fusarium torreyae]|uniref:L-rhamnono-gamma-lactonase n=1 Tax=Fusarium torreyae TaxID=1237075 RepID=A0A9W8S5K4_9HYPO|nr:L-rhamnono-gamma-lactonase [Fusarium torreyae]